MTILPEGVSASIHPDSLHLNVCVGAGPVRPQELQVRHAFLEMVLTAVMMAAAFRLELDGMSWRLLSRPLELKVCLPNDS